jgi:hypothetical protein
MTCTGQTVKRADAAGCRMTSLIILAPAPRNVTAAAP